MIRVLDLYCAAGGAAMGIHQAWPDAEITGVDLTLQPHYPFNFVQGDALEVSLKGYDFIWASPPCQRYSTLTKWWGKKRVEEHPDLIDPTRRRLKESGKPYVIENVVGAPLVDPVMLCGSMFGLRTKAGDPLRRHRKFETSWPIVMVPHCQHSSRKSVGVYGHAGGSSKRDGKFHSTQEWAEAMGIDWMTGTELAQAIPPAYSKWIVQQYMESCT